MEDVHARVFISCVSDEFGSYRDALRRKITRQNVEVKVQEDFIAAGLETLAKLDDYIRHCDVVVHLVGDMTGSMAKAKSLGMLRERYPDLAAELPCLKPYLEGDDRHSLSYTQWEAWLAIHHHKALIIATPNGAPRDPRYVLDKDQREAQDIHLSALKGVGRHPEIAFTSVDGLVADILASGVYDVLVNAGLESQKVKMAETAKSSEQEIVQRYMNALLATFRLEGAGISLDGASGHARALADAYSGMYYAVNGDHVPLSGLVGERRRIVLLGSPGSGKSVTTKYLLGYIARRDGRMPVYLRLAEFAAEQSGPGEVTSAQFIQAFAARAAKLGTPELDARRMERILVDGKAIVALDGFDEIGGKIQRERIASAIGQLSETAPNICLIVTSRPAEYDATPLPPPTTHDVDEFVMANTLPLEGDQVRQFLRVCFKDDGALWQAIRHDPNLLELATTPLMLTLLGLLGQKGPLPAGELALYDAVVATAMDSWESAKGSAGRAAAREALEDLALAMQQRDTPAESLPQSQALRVLGGDQSLLDWLVLRTGVLLRHEQQGATSVRAVIQIAHLQLQEYLAGCALARVLMRSDGEGKAIVTRWGSNQAWAEAQRYAAAQLARLEAYEVLEEWVLSRLPEKPASVKNDPDGAILSAWLLGQADADFLPAAKAETLIVRMLAALVRDDGNVYRRIAALCALVPRPTALGEVRGIALQTKPGLKWLGRKSRLPGADTNAWLKEEALAACIRALCIHGADLDAKQAVDWIAANIGQLTEKAVWAGFTPDVIAMQGVVKGECFLRDLVFSESWLEHAAPDRIVGLLDAIELAGQADAARKLSMEGIQRDAIERATAGFALWLEKQEDPEALAASDGYYSRLCEKLARLMKGDDRDQNWLWSVLPLWPDRDSPATDALRREVLKHRQLAWFVIRVAIRDRRYYEPAREAWLHIAGEDWDNSRRRGLVYEMIGESDRRLSTPLLLDVLRFEAADRWTGEEIVWHLHKIGQGEEARNRLETVLRDENTSPPHREDVQRLIEALNSLSEGV